MSEELIIYMQSRPEESQARSIPMDYDGDGYWKENEDGEYVWNGE